jgi:multiple sugar transport system permease protein
MFMERRARFAYTLILPSLILITLLNLVPMIEGFIVSMQNQNMARPNPTAFVGFEHYARALFEEPLVWGSLWRTVIWTIGSVTGAYVLALSLALLVNLDIKGRKIFRALFLIPWVIPEVSTALLWKWLYADEFGIINFILMRIGVVNTPVLWLANPDMAMLSVIIVQIWKLYPVMFIVLLAALQGVPAELHEAATIDGANMRQRFWHITLPFIRGTSVIITLLGSIWTFQNFDIIYLLTGGGPANATKILPTLMYDKAFWGSEMGYAAAIGMLMLVALLVLSIIYLLAYKAQKD